MVRSPSIAVDGANEPPNVCNGGFGTVYDFCIERPWLAGAIGRLLWGARLGQMYESLRILGDLPPGSTILDAPCGGGLAMRALAARAPVRYIGCDISAKMIERTSRRAGCRRLSAVELIRADVRELPLGDEIADACLCYNGLQMIERPEAALAELSRCLRPGGLMLGSTLVSEGNRRQRLVLSIQRRRGQAVPTGSAADLRRWLGDCGLEEIAIAPARGFVVFSARKRKGP